MCELLLKGPFLSPGRHPTDHTGPQAPPWGQKPAGRRVRCPQPEQDEHFLKWPENRHFKLLFDLFCNSSTCSVKAAMDNESINE